MTDYYGWIPHLTTGLDSIFPEISPTGYTVLKRLSTRFGSHSADTLRGNLDAAGGPVPVELRIRGSFYGTEHTFAVMDGDSRREFGMTVSPSGMMRIRPRDVPEALERNLSRAVYMFMKQKLHDDTHHTDVDRRLSALTCGYTEVPRLVAASDVHEAARLISLDFVRLAHNSLMQICSTVPRLVDMSRLEDLLFRCGPSRRASEEDAREMAELAVAAGLVRGDDDLEGISRRRLRRMLRLRLQENIERQNRLVGVLYESSKGNVCYAMNFGRMFAGDVDPDFAEIMRNDMEAIDVLYEVHRNNEEHRLAKINERMNEIGLQNGRVNRILTIVIVSFTVTSALFGFAVVLLGI